MYGRGGGPSGERYASAILKSEKVFEEEALAVDAVPMNARRGKPRQHLLIVYKHFITFWCSKQYLDPKGLMKGEEL
jgi:hypothetical protein